jgi:hypothetical protein
VGARVTSPDLASLVAATAVRIETAFEFAGSGVLVAPGQVLTCAHVVASAAHRSLPINVVHAGDCFRDEITLKALAPEPPSNGVIPSPYGWPDLAWLDVAGLTDHPWVELDTSTPALGDILLGYGHSETFQAGAPAGHRATYRVDGPVDTNVGKRWQLSAAQAAPGMSGTGLIYPATGRLFGLLTRTRAVDTNLGGWAVAAYPAITAHPRFAPLRNLNRFSTPRE